MKKAQLDIQFNWIFVMIAGAIILGLFFNIAMMQKNLSDQKTAIQSMTDWDAVVSASIKSKGVVKSVNLPGQGLNFDCSADTCACVMRCGQYSTPYADRAIFAPKNVAGVQGYLWTNDWNMPMRITNFLYATSQETKIVLVNAGAQEFYKQLKQAMPDRIIYDSIDGLENTGANYMKGQTYTRVNAGVIGMQADSTVLNKIKNAYPNAKEIYVIGIEPKDPNYGIMSFAQKTNKGNTVSENKAVYIGKEMAIAGIMAGEETQYTCSAEIALTRLTAVAKVMQERTNSIYLDSATKAAANLNNNLHDNYCAKTLAQTQPGLERQKGIFDEIAESANTIRTKNYNNENEMMSSAQKITDDITVLNTMNKDLLIRSCTTLY